MSDLAPKTAESEALSKTLRALGFRYVGPTTVYAAMQSLGVVNDHFVGCSARAPCRDARAAQQRPPHGWLPRRA
jgi:DNA-3-methyladenine glycosylase I